MSEPFRPEGPAGLKMPKPVRCPRGMTLTCPHCGKSCFIRSSRLVTETYRDAWGFCASCGFKGTAYSGWKFEVFPGLMPNPNVKLPRLEYREAVEQFLAAELSVQQQMDMFCSSG